MPDNILRAGPIPYKQIRWKRVPLTNNNISNPADAPYQGRGFSSERDGYTVADCYITIDVQAVLNAIGSKALRNKKHITQLQGGAIVVEAVNIRKES